MKRVAHGWFMLIAEPRVQRVIQFVVYLLLGTGGWLVITQPPVKFQDILGHVLVGVFGAFVLAGAIMGALAVLPGIRWLERAGIVALFVGLFMFMVLNVALGGSTVGFVFVLVLALMFVIRFMQIRKFALTPKLD